MINIKKIIYLIGERSRNRSLRNIYKELKNSEFYSLEKLREIQFIRMKELLLFSYENSNFYKNKFNEINFNPYKDFNSILDIKKLPIINKEQLIKFNYDIHTIHNFKFKKTFFSETSGSSGQALTFYKDEEWDSYNRASIYRGLSWYDVKPYDKNGYFWGYNIKFIKKIKTYFLDFLLNRYRLFKYDDKDITAFLKKGSNTIYLSGYSSMIYEVAKIAKEKNIKLKKLKLIKGTSEKIYPHYNTETIAAFGLPIISEYGSAESGIIAFECPYGNMHINEETCFVEEIEGEAIITNLIAKSFPTIRYNLGDYIKLSSTTCKCGRSHRIIEEVIGRIGKNILGYNNKKYPSLTLYYIFKNMALNYKIELSYRCEQKKTGELNIFLEKELDDKSLEKLKLEFRKYFDNNINLNFFKVDSIKPKDKKLKDFESYID